MTTFFSTFFSEKLFANQNLLHNAAIGLRLFRESPEFSINDPRYIGVRTTDALLQRSGWVETTGPGYPLLNTVTVTRRRMPAQPAETKNNYTLFDQFPFTGMGQAEAKAAAFFFAGNIDGVINPLIMVTNTPFELGRTVVKDGDAITVQPDSTLSVPNRWLVGWPNPGSGVALMLLEGPLSLFRGPPIYESSHTQHIWLYPQRANMIANPSFDIQDTSYWSANGPFTAVPNGSEWYGQAAAPLPGYLTATVGTVTTPDPGPLPRECVFVFTARQDLVSTDGCIVSQDVDPQRSWDLGRVTWSAPDVWVWTSFTDGTGGGYSPVGTTTGGAPSTGEVETYAVSVDQNSAGLRRLVTYRPDNDGGWTQVGGPVTAPLLALYDSSAVIQIGGHYQVVGGTKWPGRIYSVELRHGLDPAGEDEPWLVEGSYVSTPDTPDLTVSGGVRITARAKIDALPDPGAWPALVGKEGGGSWSNREFLLATWGPSNGMYMLSGNADEDGQANMDITNLSEMYGEVHTFGAEFTYGSMNGVAIVDDARVPATFHNPVKPNNTNAPVVVGTGGPWMPGRIYWAQMEKINQRQFVFPGWNQSYLAIPDATSLDLTDDLEIVVRAQTADWNPGVHSGIVEKLDAFGLALNNGPNLLFMHRLASAPNDWVFSGGVQNHGLVDGQTYWLKVTRVRSTGVVTFYKANNAPTEPTTWTTVESVTTTPNQALATTTREFILGGLDPGYWPFKGRILRTIVRRGVGGQTVLDVSEDDATGWTSGSFPSSSPRHVRFPKTSGAVLRAPTVANGNDITIICRAMSNTWLAPSWQMVAGRFATPGDLSWWLGTLDGWLHFCWTSNGSLEYAAVNAGTQFSYLDGEDGWFATTFQADDGTGHTAIRHFWSTDGKAWTRNRDWHADSLQPLHASASPIALGDRNTDGAYPWNGTMRYFSLANGVAADGAPGGTEVFRFDAQRDLVNSAPSAASFVATTGQTVERLGATELVSMRVTPNGNVIQTAPDELVWRFDASERTGTGTSYIDPRGRTWTLDNANAIADPRKPIWRFDANEYPGTGTSYVDPRGRTWTLTAANAITMKTGDPSTADRTIIESNVFPTNREERWTIQCRAKGNGDLKIGFVWWDDDFEAVSVDWGTETFPLNMTSFTHIVVTRVPVQTYQGMVRFECDGDTLMIDEVLCESGFLREWPYFDGESTYGARSDHSWYGGQVRQGESYSLWYNNKRATFGRLFGRNLDEEEIVTDEEMELQGKVYQWVPAGTNIVPHIDVLYPNDLQSPVVPKPPGVLPYRLDIDDVEGVINPWLPPPVEEFIEISRWDEAEWDDATWQEE